uniref:SIR2 family NAD-dependent protein deacylase n=1 Tax=Yunchengibacter salinarum TaxID=3133399 RepID=UPI0035B67272
MDDDWVPFLREEFLTPNYNPSTLHKKIFDLNQRIVISLNFDEIYEKYARNITDQNISVKKYNETDSYQFLRDDNYYIIKAHGDINEPNNIIFTKKDYSESRVKYSHFYDVLDACFLSHTLLFIGCGIDDPDFNLILENQNFKYPEAQSHYLFAPQATHQDMQDSLKKNRNIKCITYKSRNNHKELEYLIDDMVFEIENKLS